jgi:membrane-bound metal-dependent hydrolase YbcI (DUF457 family)
VIVGHLGVAFGARAFRRDAPLVWLMAASIAPDLADGCIALARMALRNDTSRFLCNAFGAWTHSLPASAVLAVLMAGAALAYTHNRAAAAVIGAVVLTHLPLDLVTGLKALWPGGPVAGLFFYRFALWDFLTELPVLLLGWALLRRSGGPRWATSIATIAGLVLIQAKADLAKVDHPPGPPHYCGVDGR